MVFNKNRTKPPESHPSSLSSSSTQPLPPAYNRRPAPATKSETLRTYQAAGPSHQPNNTKLAVTQRSRGKVTGLQKLKEKEAKERKEETNNKIASRKAIPVILRREATKSHSEKNKWSKRQLPWTVLEALHERITALRWESALKVFELLKKQLWYQPNPAVYIKLIVMLENVYACDKVQALLSDMEIQRIRPNTITYNTLIDAYGKSKRFAEMASTLVAMLSQQDCEPDVWTMNSIVRAFGNSGQIETMEKCFERFHSAGIQPNIMTFNTLLDSYGKAGSF